MITGFRKLYPYKEIYISNLLIISIFLGYSKCILAEFDYTGSPLETFPINQAKERRTMFHMKKDMMPDIYWHGLLK